MITVAFTGGGTGGHIYPGLAVAARLRELRPDLRLIWIGGRTGMDASLLKRAAPDMSFFGISAGKLRRELSFKNFLDVFRVLAGFFQARFILRKERAALLFSKGGFVSVPPCAAASSLKIPVLTHESDLSPGLATRINSRFASLVLTSYEESRRFFPAATKVLAVGNPIRAEFFSADRERGRKFLGLGEGNKPVLLVLGGSLGAQQLNSLVEAILEGLLERFTVVHLRGKDAGEAPALSGYHPYAYIDREMPDVLAAADLVFARAGAGTVWECAALGRPMLLLPLAGSGTRGDQVENAEYLEERGAARMLCDNVKVKPTADELLAALFSFDKAQLEAMSEAGRSFAQRDAALNVAGIISGKLALEAE